MTSYMKAMAGCGVLGAVIAIAGCAATDVADAPDTAGEAAAGSQIVYSTNADGTWSANAIQPGFSQVPGGYTYEGSAGANFTGPSGKTRKMGVCAMKEYAPTAPTACSTVADCASSPATLPTGGSRYCTAENDTGQKYCFFRPGPATSYCAGSPANGGVAIPPGIYYGPTFNPGTSVNKWISYACFEGCAATDPSSSSLGAYPPKQCQQYCNGVCCKTVN